MPELRRDLITGAWTIIAPERARPLRVAAAPRPRDEPCPLCPGNEEHTPRPLHVVRFDGGGPNAPGWSVRVFPNPRPALRVEGDMGKAPDGIYDVMRGIGAHEIIVDTPQHISRLAEMTPNQYLLVLGAAQARIRDLSGDMRLAYPLLFKEERISPSSPDHAATQLMALPVVPDDVERELVGAQRYYAFRERCAYCDILRHEADVRARIIYENERAVVLCPFAARFPFESWILPRGHEARFELASPETLRDVADAIIELARRVDTALDSPPLHLTVHTAPMRSGELPHYHWHVEVVPWLEPARGPIVGAGAAINTTLPEEAAAFLRELA